MRKWWPLVAICLGAFMLLVDVTIVNVALPKMATELDSSFAALQWVIDMYALALAALLLVAGALGDKFGRRMVYMAGLVLFALASLACGLAPNVETLIASRGVQGIGAAAMFATTSALIASTYRGRDLGTAFGIWGAVNGAAAATGPILGGLLTEHLGWRSIFIVNLPIAVAALVLTAKVIGETPKHRSRIDVPGAVLFTLFAGGLTWSMINGGSDGWTDTRTLVLGAVALVSLVAFVVVESRTAAPLIDLALLRRPAFAGLMVGAALLPFAAFASLTYASIWLQTVKGLSPIETGLAMTPMAAVAFFTSALGGRILHGLPARFTIGIGLLLIGAGSLLMMLVGPGSTWTALVPGLVVTGLGVGAATPQLISAALAAVPPRQAGIASGATNTFRQLGYAIGIALLGTVFTSRMETSLAAANAQGDPSALSDALAGGASGSVLAQVPEAARAAVRTTIETAFASGLDRIFLIAGVLGLVAGLAVLALVRQAPTHEDQAGHEPSKSPRPEVAVAD